MLMTMSPHKLVSVGILRICLWWWKMFTIWMRLVYLTCPSRLDIAQGKVRGHKIQKDRLTLALVVNMTSIDKLKLMIIYKYLCPRCFERWLPTNYMWWFANPMAWMTSNVFECWMMSLNVHFKSQKQRYFYVWTILLLIPLSILVRVNHLVFQPYSWVILRFISYQLMLQVWYNPRIRE